MKIAVDKLQNLTEIDVSTGDKKVVAILLGNEDTRDELVRDLISDGTIYDHQIPLPIIKAYSDQLDWISLVKSQLLPEEIIREFAERYEESHEMMMDIYMATFGLLSKEFIWEYREHFNWDSMSMNPHVSLAVLDENFDKLNWSYISTREDLTQEFIKKHKTKVNWAYISMTQDVIPGMEDKWDEGVTDFGNIGKMAVTSQIKDKRTLSDEEKAFVKEWERQVIFSQLLRKQNLDDVFEKSMSEDDNE